MNKQMIGWWTLVSREARRFLRIWQQTLLPPAITMSLYFMIFGNVIGHRIGTMHQVPYVQFIAPGLMLLAMITNSYANVASSLFTEKYQHSIEELLMSPLSHTAIVAGFVMGGVLRGLLVGGLVWGVAHAFVDLHIHEMGWLLLTATMITLLFALAGFINAIFAKRFDDINLVPTFVLTPLIYLGGVFYSLDQLSGFWYQVSVYNPIVYMVNGFRHFMLLTPDPLAHTVCWVLMVANGVLFVMACGLLRRRLGSL